MRRLTILALLLVSGISTALPALEVRAFKSNRNFITEGSLDRVDWYQKGLVAMTDYANYKLWGIKGLDGNDPVSALWWENIQDYQFQPPDTLIVKYRLVLPWPLGTSYGQIRFRADESALAMDELRLDMIDKVFCVEQVALYLAARDSPRYPGRKMVQFRVAIRFEPLIEMLVNHEDFNRHLSQLVGILAGNLETYCRSSDR